MTAPSAEERLDELMRQTRRAQRLAGIGSWEWDVAADRITWSDELYNIFGVDPDRFEASYEAYLGFIHPDDRARLEAVVQKTFEDGAGYEIQHRVVRPDGSVRHVHSQGAAQMKDGKVTQLYGIAQDVTAEAEAEQARRAAQQFFELSPDMMCVVDAEGRFQRVNAAARTILGRGPEELLGRPFMNFLYPADQDQVTEAFQALGQGDALTDQESRGIHADGTTRWYRWSAVAGDEGTIHAIVRDVTDTHQRMRRFEAILESAPDAMIIVDGRGHIIMGNKQVEALFGFKREELIGEGIEVLVPDNARSHHAKLREGYMANPEVRPMGAGRELTARRKDGSEFPVEISLSPMESDEGRLIVAAVRDITERREAEEQRRIAEQQQFQIERLEEVTQFKTQLLNTASHELNTPITPMRLQLHMLGTQAFGPLNDKQQRAVHLLKRNVDRLSGLVADVLDVARMESGKLKVELAPMDLREIIEEAQDTFVGQAEQKGILMALDPVPEVQVLGDHDRLSQVLINFISNAIKFTDDGGVIRTRAKVDDHHVRVEVQDTGRGLTKEEIEQVFQPFSQVHKRGETSEPGTGLGLFICKGIIEQHQGTIGCTSDGRGDGTTFWFEVPLAPDS